MVATVRIAAAAHGSFRRIRQVAPHVIHGSFGLLNNILIGSAIFAGLAVVTNTQTDRQKLAGRAMSSIEDICSNQEEKKIFQTKLRDVGTRDASQ